MGFGPSEEDGYGVCYNPQGDEFRFSVTSFNHYPDTDSRLLGVCLMQSLREMRDVMVASREIKAKL